MNAINEGSFTKGGCGLYGGGDGRGRAFRGGDDDHELEVNRYTNGSFPGRFFAVDRCANVGSANER